MRGETWSGNIQHIVSGALEASRQKLTHISDFVINEDYVPSCALLRKNPYKAVSRLVRENFRGRGSEGAFERHEEQKSATWKDYPETKKVRRLGEDEQLTIFPRTEWPPWQSRMKTLVTHHINEWNEALGWTPQIFNEWLAAYGNANLLIKLPDRYLIPGDDQSLTPVSSYADLSSGSSSRQSLQKSPYITSSPGSVSPYDCSISESSSQQSLHELSPAPVYFNIASETPPRLSMLNISTDTSPYEASYMMPQISLHAEGRHCSCLECEEDREFAEAIAHSAQEYINETDRLQILEDEAYARYILEEENRSLDAADYDVRERLAQDERIADYYAQQEQRKAEEITLNVREQILEDHRFALELEKQEDGDSDLSL